MFFDDVRVEKRELVDTLDGELLDVLNTERIVTTAGLVATAELAIRLEADYAKERKIFGGAPIESHHVVHFPLAEAHIHAACARLMNHKAAAQATGRAIQTLVGMGHAKKYKGYHVKRLWRDARLFRFTLVTEETEEMVLNLVAEHDLKTAQVLLSDVAQNE